MQTYVSELLCEIAKEYCIPNTMISMYIKKFEDKKIISEK